MTSSHRARTRRVGVALMATAVVASGLTPLGLTAAAAAEGPAPATPTVVSPTSYDAVLKDVVLDWAAVPGATKYQVQVDTDEQFSGEPTLSLTTVASRAVLPVSLPHAAYSWRVAAVNEAGQSRWSTSGGFRRAWGAAPTPIAPSGTVPSDEVLPTFRWAPIPSASEYQLQVSTSPLFDAPYQTQAGVVTESCFTTRTQVTPFNSQAKARNDGAGDCTFSLLGTGETRYWRVRGLDHVVDGAPELETTPVVDEGVSSQPPAKADSLDTGACPAAPGTTAASASPSPSPTSSASASPSPSASASAAPAAAGGCEPAHTVEKGPWSASRSFVHTWPAPTTPVDYRTLARPAAPSVSRDVCTAVGGAEVCRDFPTLTWSRTTGASWYRVYVALDPDRTNIHSIIETPGFSWTPTAQWRERSAGAHYYVFVQACTTQPTSTGVQPGCGTPSLNTEFDKVSPRLGQTGPADAARLGLSTEDVVLSWQPFSEAQAALNTPKVATSEAYAYRVQITTPDNPDFLKAGLVDEALVDQTHYVSEKKALADGAYLWRVQAVDASGHALPWSTLPSSTPRSFVRDTTRPTATAAPVVDVDPAGTITVRFSEAVTGVSGSSVFLKDVPATVVASPDGRSATVTPTSRLTPGSTLSLTVTDAVKDLAGNAATTSSTPISVASPATAPSDEVPGAKEVVLDWTAVPGAKKYLVQVDTDDEWSDEPTLSLTTVASRITLPVGLPHASYVWRWAAVTDKGQGRWSANGSFTRAWTDAPTPLSPKGAVDPALGVPTFSWTPVATASEYQLQVSTSPYFDAPFRSQAEAVTESCFTTRTSITPFNGQAKARNDGAGDCVFSLLGTDEPRFWRVRPLDHLVDDAPEVNTTPVVDEGVSSLPPAPMDSLDTSACPTGSTGSASGRPTASPSASASASASPSASASASPSASASASPSASASASPSASASAAPTGTPAAPAAGGGCEPAHTVEKGAWSDGVEFSHAFPAEPTTVKRYVDLVLPRGAAPVSGIAPMPTPTLSSDVCKDGVCRDFPTVSWSKVDGAQWYRLYVALDAQYTNIQEIVETPATTWTPTAQWRDSTAGSAYYVIVQPCTTSPSTEASPRDPGCDDPSAPVVFRKSSPKLAQVGPADQAQLGLAVEDVVLSWQPASAALSAATGVPATSEAYAYHVQIAKADNPDFVKEGLVEDVTVDTTHHVSTEKALADGTYLWRVQTVDASGHKLPWSATRTFTRDTVRPTFAASPRTKLPVRGAVTVGFSEPVTGVDARSTTLSGVRSTVSVSPDGRRATVQPLVRLLPGATHGLAVNAAVKDRAGNSAVPASLSIGVDPFVDDRSEAMAMSGAWKRLVASNAASRTWSRSVPVRTKQTAVTVALVGRGVEVKGCVGPTGGIAEVWADGKRRTRVDTYRSYSGCGVVLTRVPLGTPTVHTVQVRGLGLKSAKSKGTAVGIDALTAIK